MREVEAAACRKGANAQGTENAGCGSLLLVQKRQREGCTASVLPLFLALWRFLRSKGSLYATQVVSAASEEIGPGFSPPNRPQRLIGDRVSIIGSDRMPRGEYRSCLPAIPPSTYIPSTNTNNALSFRTYTVTGGRGALNLCHRFSSGGGGGG